MSINDDDSHTDNSTWLETYYYHINTLHCVTSLPLGGTGLEHLSTCIQIVDMRSLLPSEVVRKRTFHHFYVYMSNREISVLNNHVTSAIISMYIHLYM